MADFLGRIRKAVAKHIRSACRMVETEYSSLSNINGQALVGKEEKEIVKDTVALALIAIGQKAWIAEYGRGSKMVTSEEENPFLQDYISGKVKDPYGDPLFNPLRLKESLAIVGREKGLYFDLDGEPHFSTGVSAGRNFEGKRSGKYSPISPRFVIRNILFGDDGESGVVGELCEEIQDIAISELAEAIRNSKPKEIVIYDN